MLGQNHKDRHRIKFELVVHQIDVVCVNKTKIEDINVIQLQLIFTGPGHTKEEITTEGVTTVSRKSIEQADYTLTWKQQPQLEFSANLIKHKGGLYDKDRKPPELFVTRKSDNGSVQKLGSAKLELYEHVNRKVTGQFYEQEGKVVINLYKRKRLLSECEILVTFRIPDTDPSVIEEGSWRISSVITPSVSVETLNSNPPIQKSLKKPINKMLEDVLLIGIDGNIYKSNWNKMHLIFLVFGTLPDPIMNLRDLIHMLREHKQIGGYVEVVHICQAELPANNVMWPYLPFNDPSNSKFHDMFEIPEPYSEHPNIYVVNKKMTEYYAVRDYQVETYIEDRNVIELYDMWNKIPTVKSASHTDVTSPRQSLLHGQHSIAKSNSCGIINLHSHSRSSSYESSSLPLSSTRSSFNKGIRVVESKEYLDLEREHSAAKETISVLQQELVAVKQEMIQQILEREKHIKAIREELNKQQILSSNSQETLEECQRENIFFRHQVALRGTLGFRSGTFNMFKPRWFQLETLSPHNINPAISFYNGPDKLGEIVLNEIVKYDEISDTQFKITTKFANYVLSADSTADMRKWLTGIQNLQHTFCHVKKQSIVT